MSGYPDDRYGDPRPLRPHQVDAARSAVTVPAVFLILNSLLGLVVLGALAVPLVFNPDAIPRFLRDMAAQQPQGPQRDDMEESAREFEGALNANREAFVRSNAIQLAIPAALNLLVLVGAFCMRGLSAYVLCVIAAVVAVVPCTTGCCGSGMPFGIWALVVLLRPDVKAAFSARGPAADPDAEYLR